jgi:hypothetical protein
MYGVTTYPVIAAPPLLAGALQLTLARRSAPTAPTLVGAVGSPTRIGLVATDFGPIPTPFLAATWNVYDFVFVKPVTISEVAVELNVRAGCATPARYGVTT